MKLSTYKIVLAATLCVILAACTKTSKDAYKKYLGDGELVYPGRADTMLVHAGYKRVQVSVILGSDPQVKSLRIFWNNGQDSISATVTHSGGSDTVNVIVPNLAEGNYNFVVYTFDANGHQSVPFNGSGVVYGDSYTASLANRSLLSLQQSTDGTQIILSWGGAAEGDLGTKVTYVGADGNTHTVTVSASETTTTLPDYTGETVMTYQSQYKPDETAFEYFSPAAAQVTLPAFERQFDKSAFSIVILPTDVLEGGYGWLENYLWDENYNPPGFATESRVPCWFTFDAGSSAALSRFKVWQANDRLFDKESVKDFELYGSNSPASDGSWASWTKIGSYSSVKPSGLPVGENTQADIDYAMAGEEFTAPAGTPAFRYYRFKLLTNWGGSDFFTMEEVTLFTHDK